MTDQLERLRELLDALAPSNRFQYARLAAAGVSGPLASLEEFSARVPFTTKAELVADQAAHPPYGSNLTFTIECYTRFSQTSGTTGRPLAILDTAESWEWMLANWAHVYRAADVRPGDRVYFAFSFGPFLGFWTAFEAATRLGLLCIPGGGLSTAARVRAIVEYGATVLCCTPSYALHLAEVAGTEGVDLARSAVRRIIVAGEPGGSIPALRARLQSAWPGATVCDHYGMTEVGPVAFQTPEENGALQVIESSYFAEIVESATGAACAAGAVGELVLTTLGRTACPLLRYRTGDLVRRDSDAAGFALAGGIVGRADDMVVIRGVNLYPAAVDAIVQGVPGIAEYRVDATRRGAMAELTITIESEDAFAAARLESALSSAFSLRIPVRLAAPGSLPRFEMKARRWNVQSA